MRHETSTIDVVEMLVEMLPSKSQNASLNYSLMVDEVTSTRVLNSLDLPWGRGEFPLVLLAGCSETALWVIQGTVNLWNSTCQWKTFWLFKKKTIKSWNKWVILNINKQIIQCGFLTSHQFNYFMIWHAGTPVAQPSGGTSWLIW